jgi:hypothetical protein
MDLATVPHATPQTVHTTLGDTAVLLRSDDSNYYTLNRAGSAMITDPVQVNLVTLVPSSP